METIYQYPITILEKHLDLFSHMNHASYLVLFEEARWDIVTQNGYGITQIQVEKKAPVILEANLQFKKELTLRQKVIIETRLPRYQKKIAALTQRFTDEDQKTTFCLLDLKLGFFHLETRKLISPSSAWLKAICAEML